MPLILKEFMDNVDNFVNIEDTLQVLINPQGLIGEKCKEKHIKIARSGVDKSKPIGVGLAMSPC